MNRRNSLILILILAIMVFCLASCQGKRTPKYEDVVTEVEELLIQKQYAEAAQMLESVQEDERAIVLARYCRGLEAGENEEFSTAKDIFQTLGDFRNSPKMYSYYLARQIETDAETAEADYPSEKLKAAKIYEELTTFRDSQERAEECRREVYQYAVALSDRKQFDLAETAFLSLGNYLDSDIMATKARADALFESGKTDEASQLYNTLNSKYQTYSDVYQAQYQEAHQLLDENAFDEAGAIFAKLGDYKNSRMMVSECQYMKAEAMLEAKRYDEAETLFRDLSDYRDSQTRAVETKYQKAADLAAEGKYQEAITIYDSMNGNGNSKKLSRQAAADELYDSGDLAGAMKIYAELEEKYHTHQQEYEERYQAAEKAYNNKEYNLAYDGFAELGAFRDSPEKATQCLYENAKEYLAREQYDKAKDIFTELGNYQDSPAMVLECSYRKAAYYAEQEQYDKAADLYDAISDYKNSASYAAVNRAINELNNGRYKQALDCYAQITDPEIEKYRETEAYYGYGLMLLKDGEYEAAAEAFKAAGEYSDAAEKIFETWIAAGDAAAENGNYEEAREWYKKASAGELIIKTWNRQAEEKLRDGDYTLARELYDTAGNPKGVISAWNAEAEAYLKAEQYDEARQCFTQAGNEESVIKTWNTEAEACLKAGKYDEARKCFLEAGNNERITDAWNQEAEEHLRKGRYAQARQCFTEAGNEERVTEAWNKEAEAYLAADQYEEARSCFSQAGNTEGINKAWETEAEKQLALGQYEDARSIYIRAGMNEKAANVWNIEGEAYFATGDYQNAKKSFLNADNQSRYEETVFEEAKVLMSAGEYSLAYELFMGISNREDVMEIIRSDPAFIVYRFHPGDVIQFGCYEQDNDDENGPEPIEWIVLSVEDHHALLISKYGLIKKPYNIKQALVTWENCTLRAWLNNSFLESAFSAEETKAILMTTVDNGSGQCNEQWYTGGGKNTQDLVFLLSYQEAGTYFPETESRICEPTAYAVAQGAYTDSTDQGVGCRWWLRSPGHSLQSASRISANGVRSNYEVTEDETCVRPAIWVDLASISF